MKPNSVEITEPNAEDREYIDDTESNTTEASAKWKNKPDVRFFKRDLEDSKREHDQQMLEINEWLDLIYIKGSAKHPKVKGRSSHVPKVIRKQVEWRYSSLSQPFLNTDRLFDVDPSTWKDTKAARQAKLLLNHQFRNRIDSVRFIDEYVRMAANTGTVICKLGWNFEEEEREIQEEVYDYKPDNTDQGRALITSLIQAKSHNPARFEYETEEHLKEALKRSLQTGDAITPRYVRTKKVTKKVVVHNHPTVDVCDHNNVIIDPTCKGDTDAANFIIYKFEASLYELRSMDKYENLEKINVATASSPLEHPDDDHPQKREHNYEFPDNDRKKLDVYEYWGYYDIDGDGSLTPIVATFVNNTLIQLEENPFPDGKPPFVAVAYNPRFQNVYGESDAELLKENQEIIGAVTRGMIDIMARGANGQVGYMKGALDVVNKRRFERGEDYEFNPNINPEHAFHLHKFDDIPQSAPYMIGMQTNDAESLTGVKAFHNGINGESYGQVVAGIRSALDATAKRDMDILRRLSNGLKQIAKKFMAMNSEFLDEAEVVRVTDEDFVPITSDDIIGGYDIKISVSTAEADEAQAKELAFMLQTLGNNVDPKVTYMLLADILDLRNKPELAKELREFEPQPDPIQQELQLLEIEVMKAKIRGMYADAQETGTKAELNTAKVGTEFAQQNKLKSDADIQNLDFLEQESGTKHARDLERQQAQAEGNKELKAMEARIDIIKQEILDKKKQNQDNPIPINQPN